MKYPTIRELQTTRDWVNVFGGYNHNLRISDSEFYEMKNMTGDDYPTLSPRHKRGILSPMYDITTDNVVGLIAKESLCYAIRKSGKTEFYINHKRVEENPGETSVLLNKDGQRQLVSMGAYVIILPDKKYINTDNPSDHGDIEATFASTDTVKFQMTMLDTTSYADPYIGITPPTDQYIDNAIANQKVPVWIDTSESPNTLKIYSTSNEGWSAVSATYSKIITTGIDSKFEIGDGVEISGITAEGAKQLNGFATIADKGTDYIVVSGLVNALQEQTGQITVKRSMPDMDFVVESNNRLWGCKYFEYDTKGHPVKVVNEIYASKLGDFKNWRVYQGTAADSYAVNVGTDGKFTGAVSHLGYPIFFKENCMHKIYGNYPANYQVQTTICRGVQEGCSKSIATVNEVLYYKARSGVCAYDGSLPVEISDALGDISYNGAVAGAIGNKYYISMKDNNNTPCVFVYDTKKNFWHKEDNIEVTSFANCRGDLYLVNNDTNQILTVKGTEGTIEPSAVDWEVVTGTMGTDSPDKKYISRIDVRMLLEIGSRVSFYAEYNSSGEWKHLFNMDGVALKSFSVPVRPERCDHMRLKIVGRGNAKIYSICKTIEWGSDK